jgi:hypothetical protein
VVESAVLADTTKRTYANHNSRLASFFRQDKEGKFSHCLDANGKINCPALTCEDMKRFFVAKLDEGHSTSSLSGHRSALKHLFDQQGVKMGFQDELSVYFKGLKRVGAKRKRDLGEEIREGKEPLDFELFKVLMMLLLTSNKSMFRWAHCYAVLTWNLMCRSNNTGNIHISRMQWGLDSLLVYFAVTKMDQGGETERPNPYICKPTAP